MPRRLFYLLWQIHLKYREMAQKCIKPEKPEKCSFFELLVFTFLGAEGAILGVQRCIKAQITQEEYGLALSTEILTPGGSIRVLYGPKVD